MDDIEAMEVCDSTDDLLEISTGFLLVDFGVLNNIVKQLAVLYVLHDEEEMAAGFDDLVQLDDGRVADELQDVDLPRNSLHIGHVDYFLFY